MIKTKLQRIPVGLDDLAKILKDDLGLKSRVDAFEKIENLTKDCFGLVKRKR